MPWGVSRWHFVWSRYPLLTRKLNEFTVCGVFAASMGIGMSPQVVWRSIVYFAVLSMVIAGSFLYESFSTLPAAGFSQGSGALLGEALGVTSALAFSFLPSSLSTPVVYSATLPIRITPRTDAITALRARALRRAAVRRCCCRKNFSRAS